MVLFFGMLANVVVAFVRSKPPRPLPQLFVNAVVGQPRKVILTIRKRTFVEAIVNATCAQALYATIRMCRQIVTVYTVYVIPMSLMKAREELKKPPS